MSENLKNNNIAKAIIISGVLIAFTILLTQTSLLSFFTSRFDHYKDVKIAVSQELIDPKSAEFKNLRHAITSTSFCGEVNAKNSFGAYTGFKLFHASKNENDKWSVTFNEELINILCD